MGHQSHGHWEPGCFALSLCLCQFQSVLPCQPCCWDSRQGHELAQATSRNVHHAQSPHIMLTFLMTMLSNSLVPKTVVPLHKPRQHLCVCGTLSQTCINTDTRMCFKLLNTSEWEQEKFLEWNFPFTSEVIGQALQTFMR